MYVPGACAISDKDFRYVYIIKYIKLVVLKTAIKSLVYLFYVCILYL